MMLLFNIIGLSLSFLLIYVGIENNTQPPIWLGLLIMAVTAISQGFLLVETYLDQQIKEW